MTKNIDSLQQFVSLRSALERERTALQARLRQIDEALGVVSASAPSSAEQPRRGRPPGSSTARPSAAPVKSVARRGRPPGGGQNKMGMRETITKLVSGSPLPISAIVDGMKKGGYVFKSKNPTNSVGAYLYGNEGRKHFVRNDGKFSAKK